MIPYIEIDLQGPSTNLQGKMGNLFTADGWVAAGGRREDDLRVRVGRGQGLEWQCLAVIFHY